MSKKIVAVDDEVDVLKYIQDILKPAGYEVETCSDSKRAFSLIKEWRPDLLLLDIWMPDRSGWEILELMQLDPTVRNIPVIFVTAAKMEVKAVEKGMEDRFRRQLHAETLFKPFDPDELLAKVESVIGKP